MRGKPSCWEPLRARSRDWSPLPRLRLAGPMGAIFLGLVVGAVCFWSVTSLKHMLGYDDSLMHSAFTVSAVLSEHWVPLSLQAFIRWYRCLDYVANGVAEYNMATQFMSQAWAS